MSGQIIVVLRHTTTRSRMDESIDDFGLMLAEAAAAGIREIAEKYGAPFDPEHVCVLSSPEDRCTRTAVFAAPTIARFAEVEELGPAATDAWEHAATRDRLERAAEYAESVELLLRNEAALAAVVVLVTHEPNVRALLMGWLQKIETDYALAEKDAFHPCEGFVLANGFMEPFSAWSRLPSSR
jgi:broad specificity phosphatase PhoE